MGVRTSNQVQRFGTEIAGGARKEGTHFRARELVELMGSQVEDWGNHNQHPQGSRSGAGKYQENSPGVVMTQGCSPAEKMTPDTQEVPGFLVRNLEKLWNTCQSYCLQYPQRCTGEQRHQNLDQIQGLSCETFLVIGT